MKKALLSLLFAAALPALSHAGECREWEQDNGVWLQACAEDRVLALGYTDYEFIGLDELGGPGILYTHQSGTLFFDPAYWIPPQDDMRLADGGGSVGIGDDIGIDCFTQW